MVWMFLIAATWSPVSGHFSNIKSNLGNNRQSIAFGAHLSWRHSAESFLHRYMRKSLAPNPHAPIHQVELDAHPSPTIESGYSTQSAGLTVNRSLLTIIPVGSAPWSECYDSKTGNIYVANAGSANVSVINPTTEKVVATIPMTGVGIGGPSEAVYDEFNNHVYVSGVFYFISINASDNSVDLNMQTNFVTYSLVYYPSTHNIYAGGGDGYLYVFNTTTNLLSRAMRLGGTISSLAFDKSTGGIFAGYQSNGNISVLGGDPLSLMKNYTSSTSGVSDIVYSSKTNRLYVSSPDGIVTLLNATSGAAGNSVYVGGTPFQLALYNNSSRIIVATGNLAVLDSSNLSILSTLSSTKSYQFGRVMINTEGNKAYLVDENNSIAVLNIAPSAGVFEVSFVETGLPRGTEWSVNLDAMEQSSTSNLMAFYALNGSYNFTIARIHSYSISPALGTIQVAGVTVNQAVAFKESNPLFIVVVTSYGLPLKTEWSVTIRSDSAAGYPYNQTFTTYKHSIETNLSNGSYIYSLERLTGFTPNAYFGYLHVNGTSRSISINWTRNPTNILMEKLFGIPITELIQFGMVAAIILGSVLAGRVIRRNKKQNL